ncbi:hypothetical protein [Streptomyces avermitilis]|uniref:hypothetical protein n=1 Tax=Streptomyces avermitilis TaxID=33903 RepID=UPI001147A39A|nr:hypothetical protein [Streptomyces avermitilis]
MTACVIEFVLPGIARPLRIVAIIPLAFLGVSLPYLAGILMGYATFMVFLVRGKTRRQVIGVLLQTLAPILLAVLAYRTLSRPGYGSIRDDPEAAWSVVLAIPLATAGIFRVIPYGKKLYWHDYLAFRHPRIPFLDLSRDGNRNVPFMAALPGQSPIRGLGIWLAGWPCSLGALGLAFWGTHYMLVTPITSSAQGLFILLAPIGVSVFNRSRKLFLIGRRHLGMVISSPKFLRSGSYVLYLRSFEDDKKRSKLQNQVWPSGGLPHPDGLTGGAIGLVTSSRDEEEHIADAMSPVGRLVAVGAPGEILPFAGAVRMYLPKASWKQPVRQLMEQARLVTLTLGSSPGTIWELSESMRILPPQRLLLILPGVMSKEEYETIREEIERALRVLPESDRNQTWRSEIPPSLPDYPLEKPEANPVIGLIHFSADWEPTFTRTPVTSSPWQNLFTQLTRGLRPAFDQLASHEEKTGRRCG